MSKSNKFVNNKLNFCIADGTPEDLNQSINATDYRNRIWAQMCPPNISENYPTAEQIGIKLNIQRNIQK